MDRDNYKILLVSFYNDEAYGLRQLHAILSNRGYDARMLFAKNRIQDCFTGQLNNVTPKEESLLADFIIKFKPDVIGFSLVSSNFSLYKRIFKRIRALGNFKIILGGWQATLNPENSLEYADIVCIGEGEDTLSETIELLYSAQPINNVKNLCFKADGKIIKNPVRPLVQDLSLYPVHVFNNSVAYFIESDEIVQKDPYFDNTRYGTMIGRGCPYSCTYCSNSFMAEHIYPGHWSRMRYRSVDHVMLELRGAKKNLPKLERINFYDEVFLPKMDWAKEFVYKYKEEIALPFYCMFYPGTCSDDMAKLLKSSLLAGVWLGIQSGSERVRREVFKRNYSNSVVREQVNIFHKYGIPVKYDFIFDNPFETFEESLESISLLLDFPEPFSVNLFSLKYFPNTKITEMALEAGKIKERDLNDRLNADHHNIVVQHNNDEDRDFVNNLTKHISALAAQSKVKDEKARIIDTIDRYRNRKKRVP